MKNLIGISMVLFTSVISLAQNLVPNPSFEELTDCPQERGDLYMAAPWVDVSNFKSTILHACSPDPGFQTPYGGVYSFHYHRIPRSGEGMAQLYIYNNGNDRSLPYLGTPLLDTMKRHMQYYIEFYVSPHVNPLSTSQSFSDAVGLAFADTLYYEELERNPVAFQPHISALSLEPAIEHRGTLITDTVNWKRISGCYVAEGTEMFAVIGNFRTGAETMHYMPDPPSAPLAASILYVDDVLIMPFDPLPDTLLQCVTGEELVLDAKFLDASYRWSSGGLESSIQINSPGTYSVEVLMDNCILRDTVVIIDVEKAHAQFPADTMVCHDEPLLLSAFMPGEYLWSDGSTNNSLLIREAGAYSLQIINECGQFEYYTDVEVERCDCRIYAPNIFSPNFDGINDLFELHFGCDYPYRVVHFSIFDRWGNQVHSERDTPLMQWNGSSRGQALGTGVYSWVLEYELTRGGRKQRKTTSGDVTLVR
jgi:gliding motility-associated-like protein